MKNVNQPFVEQSTMKVVLPFLLATLVSRFCPTASAPLDQVVPEDLNRLSASTKHVLSNDFESGSMIPWFDQSLGKVHWNVESFDSPFEPDSPAPLPLAGTKYLRVARNANLEPGLAILRSAVFTARTGDLVTFSFGFDLIPAATVWR